MDRTALNLVACGVFAMTVSVFLVPLLDVSPFIPAAATLGILGLVTVDALSWKGQGVTLLLDFFAPSQQRERIVHHEAGHFLTAYFLGIPVTGYTLTAWEAFQQKQPGLGGVQFDTGGLSEPENAIREMPLRVERYCTVLMAGIAAETLVYDQAEGGEDDRQKLQVFLKWVGLPERDWQQKERWALLQAKNLIEKYQASYQALVEAMKNRASVEECYQLLSRQVAPL